MTFPGPSDLSALEAPHVARAMFFDVQLASGRRRLHSGAGDVTIGGHIWEGVNDPSGEVIVAAGQIQEARLGEAPTVDITVAAASREWLREMWSEVVEGAACDVYWAMFDGETQAVVMDLRLLFRGRLSAPSFRRVGLTVRDVTLTIESEYSFLNFPTPAMDWTTASQRRRYPGDKGLDFIGSDIVTVWKP